MNKPLLIAAEFIRKKIPAGFKPEIALILGSGLGGVSAQVKPAAKIAYGKIPGFIHASVSGHKGEMILGKLHGKDVIVFSGRAHFYEGHSMRDVSIPVRVAARLGAGKLIVTAAAGGINRSYRPGDIVVLRDHINFMGENPLRGPQEDIYGERFPDMSFCYSQSLQKLALKLAGRKKFRADSGVYIAVSGPSYETPAEIRAFRSLGADIVGMSVVPEVIPAHQMGMEVLGLAFVSNMAAGIDKKPLNHKEVLETGKTACKKMAELIGEVVRHI